MFQLQDILFGRYSLDEISRVIEYLRRQYGEEVFRDYCDGIDFPIDRVIEYLKATLYMPNAIYDDKDNLIWEHDNYLKRHKEYLKKQEEIKPRTV